MAKDKVSFQHAKHLGGPSEDRGGYGGNLIVDSEGIGCGVTNKRKGVVLWRDANGISFDSETVAKSRVGKAVLFGVFALAAKSTQSAATITVTLKDGDAAFYQVTGISGVAVRGQIQGIISAAGISVIDDAPNPSIASSANSANTGSIADELAKLVILRDTDAITTEEFATFKAHLLK